MSKPDYIKWCNDDSVSKITDPGTTKKLGGFVYKEKPAFQFVNYLFNALWKWVLGLQGGYYDIIVGSSTQVTNKEATHVIGDLDDTLCVAGSKVLLLNGTHTLGVALSLSNNNITFHSESPAAILDVSTFTATFSGTNDDIKLVTANVGSGDIVVSGAGSIFEGFNLDISFVTVSNGAVAITSGTNNGISFNLNASNLNSGTLPDSRLSANVLTKTNTPQQSITSAENASNVTLITATYTQITSINLGTVSVGDIFLVNAIWSGVKGGTAGTNFLRVSKSGTASFQTDHNNGVPVFQNYTPASVATYCRISVLLKVTGAGNLILQLDGISNGSNTTVNTGNGELAAIQLYNA